MKKAIFLCSLLTMIVTALPACKKTTTTTNGGASLTGTWRKPGPVGSPVTYVVQIDDATKTAKIGYDAGAGFSQTGSGTYTRTETQLTLQNDVTCPGVPGTYTFNVNSTTLTFSNANDNCTDGSTRRADVMTGDWTRQ